LGDKLIASNKFPDGGKIQSQPIIGTSIFWKLIREIL